jgi:RNA polymerase sigma-70 factor (ECF subfamily)
MSFSEPSDTVPPAKADPHADDLALARAASEGDDMAFRELVERHRSRIYRFLLKHAISSAEAEELTQDVFLQAYLALPTFKGTSRVLSWLTGIALNLVRNWTSRSPWRLVEIGGDSLSGEAEGMAPDGTLAGGNPELAAAFSAALGALAACLGKLPQDAREGLMLVCFEGLSYEEAATVLGEPVGSVKSRVNRSRKLLREQLPAAHFEVLAGRL